MYPPILNPPPPPSPPYPSRLSQSLGLGGSASCISLTLVIRWELLRCPTVPLFPFPKRVQFRDFPGGPMAKSNGSMLPMQGARVWYLVRKLDKLKKRERENPIQSKSCCLKSSSKLPNTNLTQGCPLARSHGTHFPSKPNFVQLHMCLQWSLAGGHSY